MGMLASASIKGQSAWFRPHHNLERAGVARESGTGEARRAFPVGGIGRSFGLGLGMGV